MDISVFDFLGAAKIPEMTSNIFYTLGFPIFIKGIDYTTLIIYYKIDLYHFGSCSHKESHILNFLYETSILSYLNYYFQDAVFVVYIGEIFGIRNK